MSPERRFDVRTLAIASVASAVAALVTSRFWIAGTPIAAALTPVLVTLVSEMLHRPAERIADRFTASTDALPEAAGAAPPSEEDAPPARVPDEPRVSRERRFPLTVVAVTAVLAFAIGAALVTLPELITGQSLGRDDRGTTIFGGAPSNPPESAPPPAETPPPQTVTERAPEPARPRETPTAPLPGAPRQQKTTPEHPSPRTDTETQTVPAP